MGRKKTDPRVQEAASDEGLFEQWRNLCLTNGCDEAELDGTEAALRQLGPELARLRLTQAVARLVARAR